MLSSKRLLAVVALTTGGSAIGVVGLLLWGCAGRPTFVIDDVILEPRDVEVERLLRRLDSNGDDRLDADLPISPLTISHDAHLQSWFASRGLTDLHEAMDLDTGGTFTIPEGHTVACIFELLQTGESMRAHGLLVLEQAADAAGIPEPPDLIADAGGDRTVEPGDEVTLDASGSSSVRTGAQLVFIWRQIGGTPVELSDAGPGQVTFAAPDPDAGDAPLVFEVEVTDGADVATDEVTVTVEAAGPPPTGDPEAGETAYADAGCAACHGEEGGGGSAPALAGADQTEALQTRFEGGEAHFGTTLTDQEILDVAAWLRGDEPDPGDVEGPCDVPGADADEGQNAFAGCAGCHGSMGGGGSAPALVAADPTTLLEDTFGGEADHFGQTLSGEQIQDIACWLSTLEQ